MMPQILPNHAFLYTWQSSHFQTNKLARLVRGCIFSIVVQRDCLLSNLFISHEWNDSESMITIRYEKGKMTSRRIWPNQVKKVEIGLNSPKSVYKMSKWQKMSKKVSIKVENGHNKSKSGSKRSISGSKQSKMAKRLFRMAKMVNFVIFCQNDC